MRGRHLDDTGAVAVEFALLSLPLLAILLAIVDFGFAFNAKISVTQAAREGVRVVALGGTLADAQARVDDTLATSSGNLTASTSMTGTCSTAGAAVTIDVTAAVTPITPFMPSIPLTGRGVMRCNG